LTVKSDLQHRVLIARACPYLVPHSYGVTIRAPADVDILPLCVDSVSRFPNCKEGSKEVKGQKNTWLVLQ
jgi:hypothetical protein